MIWHDKGEDGLRMIEQMAELYKKDHPGVTVKSLSMPTEQWFSRSIAALNTNTAPDILFNDNTRIVPIQQSTGKLSDLKPQVDQMPGSRQKPSSLRVTGPPRPSKKSVVQIPFQRTMTGLGVRKSWLEKVGDQPPKTWDDVLRIGKKFQDQDPDGNGKKDTFGIAMQAGDAPSITGGGINLLVYGNGLPHPLVNEKGDIVIDQPDVAQGDHRSTSSSLPTTSSSPRRL